MNNFKKLGISQERDFNSGIEEKKVSSQYFFLQHIGNVVDHFLGKAADMFVWFSGGEKKAGPKAPPDQGLDPFEDVPPQRH